MTRNVTVLIESTQSRYDFTTDATTLGELKAQLNDMDVVYNVDNVFKEARSKTTLTSDDSILPSNIPFKGGVTNDLVFLCTTPQHKIKQGCETRSELYDIVKSLEGLADFIKKATGKNYTVVSNADLSSLVHKFESTSTADTPKEAPKNTKTVQVVNVEDLRSTFSTLKDNIEYEIDRFIDAIEEVIYEVETSLSEEEVKKNAYNEAVENSDFNF